MILVPYDSELWTVYNGAYGNVCEEIKMVMGDTGDMEDYEEGDAETAYENIWANLLHQGDFYEAVYLVMPYLVKIFEKNEGNFDRQFSIISNAGACLAADIPYFTKWLDKSVLVDYENVHRNYEEAVWILQEKTKEFIKNHLEKIKTEDSCEKWQFSLAVMAILGDDREAAYALLETDWEEGCVRILCDQCGYDDECNYFDDKNFLESITPAASVQWDGIHYDDACTWFGGFLRSLELEEAKLVPCLYGTYTCPECGRKKTVIEFMKAE